jgi:hypothetical protein
VRVAASLGAGEAHRLFAVPHYLGGQRKAALEDRSDLRSAQLFNREIWFFASATDLGSFMFW